ncbi:MAG TPA: condensation domain-containing protein, partial [Candidatus Kapabacteria bacterium]|nr:condensation domain-containing protein [Candidatus Kapabacteria bacterium]
MFDLFLSGVEVEEELLLGFTYATKLFKKETLTRFAGYFRDIVSAVAENNRVTLKDIKISHDLGMAASKILRDEHNENNENDENDFGF